MDMTLIEDSAAAFPRKDAVRPSAPQPRVRLSTGDVRDRCLDRAMRLIDPAVASSFTPEQRRAIRTMLDLRRDRRLMLDLRGGFDLAGRRYFLSLMGGHERRRGPRRASHPLSDWLRGTLPLLAIGGLVLVALFALAAGLRG